MGRIDINLPDSSKINYVWKSVDEWVLNVKILQKQLLKRTGKAKGK